MDTSAEPTGNRIEWNEINWMKEKIQGKEGRDRAGISS